MFLARLIRIALIAATFITVYLPATLNLKIFERNLRDSVSYIVANVASAIDY